MVHRPERLAIALYIALCWLAALGTLAQWLRHNLFARRAPKLRQDMGRTRATISPNSAAHHPDEAVHHFTTGLPGNQSLALDVVQRSFDLPHLPAALDGLTILHISDLHFTGRVGKAYFREIVRVANELRPDLVALTGDYADHDDCIDWIPDTLGRLSAPCGVYYVVGNHDAYVDLPRLRTTMNAQGFVDLGGRWLQAPDRGQSLILAGNELPWVAPAPDLHECGPSSRDGGPLRIVLAHSPDQINWARRHEVDLMLCGHTHAGQIRLPLVGAVFMPSRYGVKFDYGLFDLPPTIMHVTRGVSGQHPLRWNCAPEIAILSLRQARE
jgi:predicted MPP superfamily phosphohydrolase